MTTITSTPKMGTPDANSRITRLNAFLDTYVLPYPVKYLTNRLTILATLCLLIPLIAFANVQVFVLATNSYLNVMSVVVSSTVLLYSTISEVRDRKAAEQREAPNGRPDGGPGCGPAAARLTQPVHDASPRRDRDRSP